MKKLIVLIAVTFSIPIVAQEENPSKHSVGVFYNAPIMTLNDEDFRVYNYCTFYDFVRSHEVGFSYLYSFHKNWSVGGFLSNNITEGFYHYCADIYWDFDPETLSHTNTDIIANSLGIGGSFAFHTNRSSRVSYVMTLSGGLRLPVAISRHSQSFNKGGEMFEESRSSQAGYDIVLFNGRMSSEVSINLTKRLYLNIGGSYEISSPMWNAVHQWSSPSLPLQNSVYATLTFGLKF